MLLQPLTFASGEQVIWNHLSVLTGLAIYENAAGLLLDTYIRATT